MGRESGERAWRLSWWRSSPDAKPEVSTAEARHRPPAYAQAANDEQAARQGRGLQLPRLQPHLGGGDEQDVESRAAETAAGDERDRQAHLAVDRPVRPSPHDATPVPARRPQPILGIDALTIRMALVGPQLGEQASLAEAALVHVEIPGPDAAVDAVGEEEG